MSPSPFKLPKHVDFTDAPPNLRQRVLASWGLVFLVFLVFGQTVGHEFVNFDDDRYIYENPVVLEGLHLRTFDWAFTKIYASNWHPLTTLTHQLDYSVYGLWAGGHHLTNLILHALVVVLLFYLVLEWTGALRPAVIVAALFAIHPLRVESVAWVAERKDVLSALFFLLTLQAYQRWANGTGKTVGRVMVLFWFALGLMSKPMLVTLPFVLLLMDYWPLGRLQRVSDLPRVMLEKWPLYLFSALSCLVTVQVQKNALAPLELLPLSMRIENALVACFQYLKQWVWPTDLAAFYPAQTSGWSDELVFLSALIFVSLSVLAWNLRHRHPYLLMGWLWYLGMLVPVIGLLQVGQQAHADRYTYLPQIGLLISLTLVADGLVKKWRVNQHLLTGGFLIILCLLMGTSIQQTRHWRNSFTLWEHALKCTQNNAVANNNLGDRLFWSGRREEAVGHFQEAIRIIPSYTQAHYNLGRTYLALDRVDEAIVQFRLALKSNPHDAEAYNNLGNILLKKHRAAEASVEYKTALRIDPDHASAHYNLGKTFQELGQFNEALEEYRTALRLNPSYSEAANNLGSLLFRTGQREEAMALIQKAILFNPENAEAHNNLGNALGEMGRAAEAIAEYREAVRIKPDYANALGNLSNALFASGSTAEAIPLMEKAVTLQPSHAGLKNNLAWMLSTANPAALRQGKRALQLAMEVNQSTVKEDPAFLRTLSAAQAESGQFALAAQTAQQALRLIKRNESATLRTELEKEFRQYQSGRPYSPSP